MAPTPDQIHAQPFDSILSLSAFQGDRGCAGDVWYILRARQQHTARAFDMTRRPN